MKAIFLCRGKAEIQNVYGHTAVAKLRNKVQLDEMVYNKSDILSNPMKFSDTQIVFSTWGMPVFSKEEIQSCFPALKCVFYAAGSVQEFARPFLDCGVRVFSASAANAVPVAEYTVSQIILANKGFFALTRLMSQKQLQAAELRKNACAGNYKEKIGLIGCGTIGSLVARMLKEYEFEVFVYDPFLPAEKAKALNVTVVDLDELFASCRVVSNHLANNAATKGLLQYKHFLSMPLYSTFLNTGRGAQVVEKDLVKALSERPDLTAVLDVTDPEPAPISHPFYTLSNCFLTPHIAGSLGGEVERMAEYMVKAYECFCDGALCKYEVTEKMLETMA